MRSSSRSLLATALVCALLISSVAAHHSFMALYDMGTQKEIAGRITEIAWVNPHIRIDVAAPDGQIWKVEAGPRNLLSLMGIEKDKLRVGDNVRMLGNPGRTNAQGLWVSNILLPAQKTELLFTPGAQPHQPWAAEIIVGDPNVLNGPSDRPTGPGSFFRTWETTIPEFPKRRGEPGLTEAGRRAQARYESGPAVADCEVPGMPFAMVSPYPIEIVKEGDNLLIRGEAYDLKRVVYLAEPATPPAPSPLGLSVGRIEGDELVIKTSRIDYHSYGDLGPAQSNQSEVVERFKLSPDGLKLDYEITITDPVMLAEEWKWGGSFFATTRKIKEWDCGADRGGSSMTGQILDIAVPVACVLFLILMVRANRKGQRHLAQRFGVAIFLAVAIHGLYRFYENPSAPVGRISAVLYVIAIAAFAGVTIRERFRTAPR